MEFFDLQDNLLVTVVGFDFPASEIEGSKFVGREDRFIIEIGQEDGDGSIGTDQFDHPEFDGIEVFSLFLWNPPQETVAGVNTDFVFLFSALYESLYSRECGLSRTAEYKIASESSDEIVDHLVARVTTVKQEHRAGRCIFQKWLHLIALGRIHWDHCSCYRQPPEDIVHGGDKALGIVSFPGVLEAALGIKLLPDLLGGWKIVLGPVYAVDRHTVPDKFRVLGPPFVSQAYSIIEYMSEDTPVDLAPRLGDRAAVDGFSFRPKATSPGSSEEFTRLHVHPLCLSAGSNG